MFCFVCGTGNTTPLIIVEKKKLLTVKQSIQNNFPYQVLTLIICVSGNELVNVYVCVFVKFLLT